MNFRLPRLYDDLAWLFRLLTPPEDYAAEADEIRALLHMQLGEPQPGRRHRILELGAGGGHTLSHLVDEYDAVAVDLSHPMLELCRDLVPEARTQIGDMRTIRLDETFDAVLCHDAVDYMVTEEDLRHVFDTAAAHLQPGGVLVVAPTYLRETFVDHEASLDQNADDRIAAAFFSYVHDPDPNDTAFEMVSVYLINEGGQVRVVEDRHTCGLFSEATWLQLLADAGLDAMVYPSMRNAFGDNTTGVEVETPYRLFLGAKQ